MEIVCLVLALMALATDMDAVFVLLLAIHLVLGAATAWKLKATQPMTAIFLTAYAPMYFLNPLAIHLGWLELDSTEEALRLSNVLMMVGMDLFIFAARRLRMTKFDLNTLQPIAISEARIDIAIYAAVAVYGIATMVQLVGMSSMSKSAFDLTKSEIATSGEHSLLFMIARFSSMALPFAGFFIALKPKKKQPLYLVGLLFFLLLHFVLFRVRQVPIATGQGFFIGMLASRLVISVSGKPVQRRLPRYMGILALTMVPILAVTAVGIRWVRGMYSWGTWDFSAESAQRIGVSTFQAGDLSVSYMTRQAIDKFPSEHPYFYGASYYRIFFTPIPRSLWPDKPQPTQREFAAVLSPKNAAAGVTIPAGIVGDFYVNFGSWGVLGMLVVGFAFGQEKYRSLTALMVMATSGAWIFHFTRGSQTGPLVILVLQYFMARGFTIILAPKPAAHLAENANMWWAWVPQTLPQRQRRPAS
jgi:hypothetical protein